MISAFVSKLVSIRRRSSYFPLPTLQPLLETPIPRRAPKQTNNQTPLATRRGFFNLRAGLIAFSNSKAIQEGRYGPPDLLF